MIGPETIETPPVLSKKILNTFDKTSMQMGTAGHPEMQYLNLVSQIISSGQVRMDRTGTGTKSMFAPPQLRFSMSGMDGVTFPLLTTKKVFLRPVFEELMWFVRGHTDATLLTEKKVHIWDANGSREALDRLGFSDRREGDLGPVYGFQWRHFGAEYKNCETDYSGMGVDQLAQVVEKILFNPCDRRIIMSAWNPQGSLNSTYLCLNT